MFIQQLVLFAPQAVHATRHVPLLRAALRSSRQALRRTAATTLKQLAGLDAAALAREGVEVALFAALDAEPDSTSSGKGGSGGGAVSCS
jgi:high-affinity Fe2+/Pb2+ permease